MTELNGLINIHYLWERWELTSAVAWDLAVEEIEDHWSLYDTNCDHRFLRFRCAACLHSLSTDDGSGEELWGFESLVLGGVGDDASEPRVSIVELSIERGFCRYRVWELKSACTEQVPVYVPSRVGSMQELNRVIIKPYLMHLVTKMSSVGK